MCGKGIRVGPRKETGKNKVGPKVVGPKEKTVERAKSSWAFTE